MSPETVLATDAVMMGLMKTRPSPRIGKAPLFLSLIRAIISQQLSEAAAATIFKRLSSIADISPTALLDVTPEVYRSCGISKPKAGYIYAISKAVQNGQLDGIEELADEEAIGRLVMLKGVGRWTAEMILIFALGREDVWACDDAGLRRAARQLYGVESVDAFKALGERFRPFRSHAAWYLWSSLEKKESAS